MWRFTMYGVMVALACVTVHAMDPACPEMPDPLEEELPGGDPPETDADPPDLDDLFGDP